MVVFIWSPNVSYLWMPFLSLVLGSFLLWSSIPFVFVAVLPSPVDSGLVSTVSWVLWWYNSCSHLLVFGCSISLWSPLALLFFLMHRWYQSWWVSLLFSSHADWLRWPFLASRFFHLNFLAEFFFPHCLFSQSFFNLLLIYSPSSGLNSYIWYFLWGHSSHLWVTSGTFTQHFAYFSIFAFDIREATIFKGLGSLPFSFCITVVAIHVSVDFDVSPRFILGSFLSH